MDHRVIHWQKCLLIPLTIKDRAELRALSPALHCSTASLWLPPFLFTHTHYTGYYKIKKPVSRDELLSKKEEGLRHSELCLNQGTYGWTLRKEYFWSVTRLARREGPLGIKHLHCWHCAERGAKTPWTKLHIKHKLPRLKYFTMLHDFHIYFCSFKWKFRGKNVLSNSEIHSWSGNKHCIPEFCMTADTTSPSEAKTMKYEAAAKE